MRLASLYSSENDMLRKPMFTLFPLLCIADVVAGWKVGRVGSRMPKPRPQTSSIWSIEYESNFYDIEKEEVRSEYARRV